MLPGRKRDFRPRTNKLTTKLFKFYRHRRISWHLRTLPAFAIAPLVPKSALMMACSFADLSRRFVIILSLRCLVQASAWLLGKDMLMALHISISSSLPMMGICSVVKVCFANTLAVCEKKCYKFLHCFHGA